VLAVGTQPGLSALAIYFDVIHTDTIPHAQCVPAPVVSAFRRTCFRGAALSGPLVSVYQRLR